MRFASVPPNQDDIVAKWVKWLDRINDDITMLHADRQIWREMMNLLQAKEQIPEREFMMSWITQQSVAALAMGIRRQRDKRTDVISLARLLQEIKDNPDVLTRDRFVEQTCVPSDDEYLRSAMHKTFDRWADGDGANVSPELIQERIDQLDSAVEKIVHHVNKKFAHTDEGEPPTGFTYGELDKAMKEIGDLLVDLHLLLTCASLTSADPTIQVPWRRAFVMPWLPDDEVAMWQAIQARKAEREARS